MDESDYHHMNSTSRPTSAAQFASPSGRRDSHNGCASPTGAGHMQVGEHIGGVDLLCSRFQPDDAS